MVVGGLACLVHGFCPFCLTTSGSRRVRALYTVLSSHPLRRAGTELPFERASDGGELNWSI